MNHKLAQTVRRGTMTTRVTGDSGTTLSTWSAGRAADLGFSGREDRVMGFPLPMRITRTQFTVPRMILLVAILAVPMAFAAYRRRLGFRGQVRWTPYSIMGRS